MTNIVYVDEHDTVIGAGSMEEAFTKGIPHRVSRIYLVNEKGEVLIARRALKMRTSPGKWGESAAGHVDEGEDYQDAAARELKEEIGVTGVELKEVGRFYYEAPDEHGGIRRRFNATFVGRYDGTIAFDPHEVAEIRWIAPDELRAWIEKTPKDFTTWAVKAFAQL